MRELGIPFSAELVPPIMADLKTVTRRIVTPQPEPDPNNPGYWIWRGGRVLLRADYGADYVHTDETGLRRAIETCARYQVGDRLWVRECHSTSALTVYPCPTVWYRADFGEFENPAKAEHICPAEYRDPRSLKYGNYADCFACWATRHREKFRWKSGRFMPRKYARTWIEVLDLRAEQLHWITEDDAEREGVTPGETADMEAELCAHFGLVYLPYKTAFARTWDRLHGRDGHPFASNAWVVRYEFRRIAR